MKTTLILDDTMHRRLREEAARQGRTMSELVEAAVRRMFAEAEKPHHEPKELPSFDMGEPLVDIADRDALYRAMEEDD